jgi:class 3 adenylate cyclase
MVGSTARASSLSTQAADELRRDHFSILRQAVAESGGTEVKNLGDGLMVVFSSASTGMALAPWCRGHRRVTGVARELVGEWGLARSVPSGCAGPDRQGFERRPQGPPVVRAHA